MQFVVACLLALTAMPSVYAQQVHIDKLLMITMAVSNMDKSKEFYTSLGFEATRDMSQGGQRWVALSLPGGGASLNLATVGASGKPVEKLTPGTLSVYVTTADVQAAWEAIKAKGITPTQALTRESWEGSPWAAWFSVPDPDGNQVLVIQMK